MEFEWDPAKAGDNEAKHKVSFSEATEVFADALSSSAPDPDHSLDEKRFVIFGRTLKDRYLVVAFTDRGGNLRIISAREMTRRERQAYELSGVGTIRPVGVGIYRPRCVAPKCISKHLVDGPSLPCFRQLLRVSFSLPVRPSGRDTTVRRAQGNRRCA